MSDEQAARITTVGQAVDFVLAQAPEAAAADGEAGVRDATPDREPGP
jgi:hypothetical protein